MNTSTDGALDQFSLIAPARMRCGVDVFRPDCVSLYLEIRRTYDSALKQCELNISRAKARNEVNLGFASQLGQLWFEILNQQSPEHDEKHI